MTQPQQLSGEDRDSLERAHAWLEQPGFAMKVADTIGKPVEWALAKLPEGAQEAISAATDSALRKAVNVALATLGEAPSASSASHRLHKVAAGITGAAGGAVGLLGLPVELPISTSIAMRSIADIARAEGEDLRAPEVAAQILMVFAMGGRSSADDAAETAYFAVRASFARTVSEAAAHVAKRGLSVTEGPAFARLIARVAARFEVVVSEKLALQLVPLVGAAGGATINVMFMDHFQQMARGHFVLRRLERTYGSECVRYEYEQLTRGGRRAAPRASR